MNEWVRLIRHTLRSLLARPHIDVPLGLGLLALSILGLFVLYSASGGDFGTVVRQGVRLGIGAVAMLTLARINPAVIRLWSPYLYGAGALMLVMVLVLGEGRGANRWLDLGVVRFQPSEIMKLALPMMLAALLSSQSLPPRWPLVLASGALIGLPAALIAMQPDLGTALLVGVSGAFVLYFGGLSWRWITGIAVTLAASAPVAWQYMHEYQRNRVRMLLDPESDPLGKGWNIIQSKIAVGSGGIYGKGWQNGTQSHLDFLPERSTDFILAVLGEEFGLLGVSLLLLLYLGIIGRGLYIANHARDNFSRLLAGALSLTFFVYVLVNVGMVTGLLPVVGVPLPMVSYGGTSIVTLMAGFGLLMSIHTHKGILYR